MGVSGERLIVPTSGMSCSADGLSVPYETERVIADPDTLTRQRAWVLATILAATYIISRGLAKTATAYYDGDHDDDHHRR